MQVFLHIKSHVIMYGVSIAGAFLFSFIILKGKTTWISYSKFVKNLLANRL